MKFVVKLILIELFAVEIGNIQMVRRKSITWLSFKCSTIMNHVVWIDREFHHHKNVYVEIRGEIEIGRVICVWNLHYLNRAPMESRD